MLKKILLATAPLAIFCAQPLSRFGLDRTMSPSVSADDFFFLNRSIQYGEERLWGEGLKKRTFGYGLGRAVELIAFYNPMACLTATAQHEVFGHGWRVRDIGKSVAHVTRYAVGIPFPYSKYSKKGMTWIAFSSLPTDDQFVAIAMAGLEAEAVMARMLKKEWIQSGAIEGRMYKLYLTTALSFTEYALSLKSVNFLGHDIANYILDINRLYPNDYLSKETVKNASLFNLLDPMLYYSCYAAWRYILTGENTHIPMIRLKGGKWLPNFRIDMSPFGLENYFENYVMIKDRLLYIYARGGEHGHSPFFGAGFDRHGIFKYGKTSYDVQCDFWKQPKMGLSSGHERPGGNNWGMRALVTLNVQLGRLVWYEQFGFKTAGYLQGESLKKALIGRFGIAARF